jgi:hypothetical protein
VGDYLPEEPALLAHLYAVEGYAEVMLAELFCSGVPLSTIDYRGDYTLRPGSSTEQVFTHAAALFDTAIMLAGTTDSASILNLSRVGRARALLGLGDYSGAAAAAAEVPDAFRYTLQYAPSATALSSEGIGFFDGINNTLWAYTTVSNREGTNGLDWRTSGDPRTTVTARTVGTFAFYHPDKYRVDGNDTIVLASGVEARLIAAEAALKAGTPSWLTILNQLRQTAITPALPDTTDPGSDTARVSLLFRERAFWLFLTGHRQGDLRRLVRQYERPVAEVYPVGTGTYGGSYANYIDMPIPREERDLNSLSTGCLSRD